MNAVHDAIGINLGARNAFCAYAGSVSPVMIPNRWGRASTPSAVGWNGDWVVGEANQFCATIDNNLRVFISSCLRVYLCQFRGILMSISRDTDKKKGRPLQIALFYR